MSDQEGYELHLKGFRTRAEAQEFLNWYEGAGEQDAQVWFECRQDEGIIDVDFMPVDGVRGYEWKDNALVAHLNLE
jgi:hypothetical protein